MTPALLIGVPALAALAGGFVALHRWHRRNSRRTGYAVLALVTAYWVVVPLVVAVIATHRPHVAERAYIPSRNGAAVIVASAHGGDGAHARMLARHGYGVLTLHVGEHNAFGWGEAKAIESAVAWLRTRPDVRSGRIGGLGLSVGAEQLLEAEARNHTLRAVVADGAGERSVRETLLHGPSAALALPEAAIQTLAVAALSGSAPPPSLRSLVPRIAPRAVFLVYAGHGGGGEELNRTYFDAAGQPKLIWRIPEAKHTGGIDVRPRAYERRVVGFFDRYLLLT